MIEGVNQAEWKRPKCGRQLIRTSEGVRFHICSPPLTCNINSISAETRDTRKWFGPLRYGLLLSGYEAFANKSLNCKKGWAVWRDIQRSATIEIWILLYCIYRSRFILHYVDDCWIFCKKKNNKNNYVTNLYVSNIFGIPRM